LVGLLLLSVALGKGSVVVVIYFYKIGVIFAKICQQLGSKRQWANISLKH
jgi:hypothetical protein